jgi:DNA-binding transcriptional ArsR family regulator
VKRTTRFFKALSDRTRLRILWLLFRNGQASADEIERVLDIPQDRASSHLKYLLNAGVIMRGVGTQGPRYRVMQQTDPFRRATLEGLKCRLCEPDVAAQLEQKLKE